MIQLLSINNFTGMWCVAPPIQVFILCQGPFISSNIPIIFGLGSKVDCPGAMAGNWGKSILFLGSRDQVSSACQKDMPEKNRKCLLPRASLVWCYKHRGDLVQNSNIAFCNFSPRALWCSPGAVRVLESHPPRGEPSWSLTWRIMENQHPLFSL